MKLKGEAIPSPAPLQSTATQVCTKIQQIHQIRLYLLRKNHFLTIKTLLILSEAIVNGFPNKFCIVIGCPLSIRFTGTKI